MVKVKREGLGFIAYQEGRPDIQGSSDTVAGAVGDLFMTHRTFFGLFFNTQEVQK